MAKKPGKSLLKSSMVVSIMTMLSRVLGLARDVMIARFIGANDNADAFFVAFRVPQFLRRLFGEGAFNQAFVPVMSDIKQKRGDEAVKALVDRVAASLGLSVLSVVCVVVVGAPVFVYLVAFGFADQPEKLGLTTNLMRITFPYLFFICMTGFFGSILNSYHRFAAPAVTPVILNLCLIAGVIFSPNFEEPVYALAVGVFFAGLFQMLFLLPSLHQLGMVPKPMMDWHDEGVQRVIKLMIPAIFGVSVSQINLLFDTLIATFLPGGSVSWLYFSDRLSELPLGVFAIAIATVILPSLSRNHSDRSSEEFSATMNWAMSLVLLIALPAATALIVLSMPILATLFLYGEMTVFDIQMSSWSLMAYALGLTAFMLIKVLAPGYFSRHDTKTPVRIGIIAMIANMVMNVMFVVPLHMYWQVGHVGLALATALSAALNAWLLYRGLQRQGIVSLVVATKHMLLAGLVASAVMAAVLLGLADWYRDIAEYGFFQRAVHVSGLVVAGAATYGVVLLALGIRPRHLKIDAYHLPKSA